MPDRASRPASLLVLTGPTAAGKSDAAMALAERLPIEIVSVDSAQVYCGMDVGTAKASAAERARVPHHGIDLLDPSESYSAARFVADATAAIADIRARGRIPLLVGGTMLYLKALRDGLDDMPAVDPAIRAAIEAEAKTVGWADLHAQLAAVDPDTANRLAPLDSQRVSRALEIWRGAGVRLSTLQRRAPAGGTPLTIVSLEPGDRSVLHHRIESRFDAMLAAGLIDEVRGLHARGDLHERLPAMRCVGYRQAWEMIEGRDDAATMREKAIAATRQLAKRQITWLRSMPQRAIVDSLAADAVAQAVDRLTRATDR